MKNLNDVVDEIIKESKNKKQYAPQLKAGKA